MKFDEIKKNVIPIISNKKVQWGVTIALFLFVMFISVNIRIQPIVNGNLIDVTTGDYTPLALDPYYFLRHAETLVANNGVYPEVDDMRYQALGSGWSTEITPQATVLIYNVMKIFNPNVTLNFANVLNPVIFFGLGLVVFFLLTLLITKNKTIAVVASGILAIIPPYLYRTLAGFSDHESIGMFGFFLALLFFAVGMSYLEKKKVSKIGAVLIGLFAGIGTTFAAVSWGGGAAFLFMILPLAFLIRWFTKKDKNQINNILFYGLWIGGIFIGGLIFGTPLSYILKRYMLGATGILTIFALTYIIIEAIITKIKILPKKIKKHVNIISVFVTVVVGGIFYQIFVGNFLSMFSNIILKIINPFGTGRVGLTVAENKQPYLSDLIGQVGKTVFYTFLVGCAIVGGKISTGIKNKKYKLIFSGSFAFFIFGILFTRLSSSSILNGENFVSKSLFFISFLALAISSIYIYKKSEWKIDTKWIFIAAWMIPMLLAVRSAIRVFFAIVPFIAMMIPITLFEIGKLGKKSKDELTKIVPIVIVIILSILLIVASFGYYNSVNYQAKAQTPSYNSDWQKAMEFVRENTSEGSVFLHWWDYGYWVQTGGNRPTVTDGGHFNGYWDHLIGRYVLTTPYPETAKSFMKAHNVSYLLIDPTDIGKYSAYSSIGDDNDSSDRASYFPTLTSNPSEIRETANGTIRIYQGGAMLDEDLIYNMDGKNIFLPKGKAGMGAITIETTKINVGNQTFNVAEQPIGIYVYNNQQYRLPIRYLYQNGNLRDFGTGINATVYVYPNVVNQQFDQDGAAMYLSEKVKDSLVAKLYLMNDPDNQYEELELVHSEAAYPFGFNYGGYRGAIKIYQVNLDEMDYIIAREEFTSVSGEYGEFDDLRFIR
ncbi:hypothetical protein KAS08_01560 [Candidatus Pacearchaeota archaeon]|nr:hypothetical protein [Candidatus Pacearchaeota archaeon]